MRLVLASASPARLSVLRAAGLDPVVRVSDVDEDALLAAHAAAPAAEKVTLLAGAKATTVARTCEDAGVVLVVGCDSMLHIDGELVGKPHSADVARERWQAMAGRTGELVTGHAVLRVVDGEIEQVAEGHAVTTVRFATPTDAELEAYLATGEPLAVAGSFTLDGLGGWFVDGIDGDPSNVIGISLPLVRRLLGSLGVSPTDLWTTRVS
ncbi:Maf family protein [Pseudonocardia oroxyli]|uniref:Nucleoside triphosphate pyrophosphatase n=1 Tax=Pseudonocardia oroxyli TaxID=366584 RepID=A0A1G7GYD4_PSEOR|nr:Maf family protein [Pseudonocardia oroxyli]SDE93101.1 septum formation protein [Pseudonocardia oroxyli]